MAKEIVNKIKLQIPAGRATAAPPVGTALGPAGIPLPDFVNRFNEATKEEKALIDKIANTSAETWLAISKWAKDTDNLAIKQENLVIIKYF